MLKKQNTTILICESDRKVCSYVSLRLNFLSVFSYFSACSVDLGIWNKLWKAT